MELKVTIEAHGATVATAVAAWLHGRAGRKVRMEIPEAGLKVEAQRVEGVEKLLAKGVEIQDRNRPKVIHEP